MENNNNLKITPLHDWHVKNGGKMVPFAGYDMPVQYAAGVINEHLCVRNDVGLFDVSHMGEFIVEGPDALSFLQRVTCNDISKCQINMAQYNMLMRDSGGVVDDLIIYRQGETKFLIVVNASNIEKDFAYLSSQKTAEFNLSLTNHSDAWALLALQGPKAASLLTKFDFDMESLSSFRFKEVVLNKIPCIVARTGYTGAPGVELFVKNEHAVALWESLMELGAEFNLKAIGLGARDTLRLEKAYPLYGHELNDTTTPIEAGLQWVVKIEKGNFLGEAILRHQITHGTDKTLYGFKLEDAGIAREHYPIVIENKVCGEVTSGTRSPSLNASIFLAYINDKKLQIGDEVFVDIRGKMKKAVCVKTPFM